MDHNRWIEMQQHPPNPNPSIPHLYDPHSSSTTSSYAHYPYQLQYHPQIQNPNPNPNPNPNFTDPHAVTDPNGALQPSYIFDSYAAMYPYAQPTMGYGYHQEHNQMSSLSAVPPATVENYYQDSAGVAHSWPAQHQYVAEPVSYTPVDARYVLRTEPAVPANPNPLYWNNPVVQQPVTGTKRKFPNKAKIVQSAWCEICKIDCNSRDVLDKHRLGKKHKKNLEKLTQVSRNVDVQGNISVGNQPSKTKKTKKDATSADLETKKRKVLEGGAATEEVRVCAICNVVCNSNIVFHYHLAGQKHASMVKKHATGTAVPLPQVAAV